MKGKNKYRNWLYWVIAFVVGATIMDFFVKSLLNEDPDIGKMVIEHLYDDAAVKEYLGEFQSSRLEIDSISSDKDSYYFTFGLQGANQDTTVTGTLTKKADGWEISRLVGRR